MKPTRVIVLTWLAWAVIVIAFQALATARLVPQYPDNAQEWTTKFTKKGYQAGHVYLLDPFMNNQVAWDSEYYLAIAVGGYNDPRSPHLTPTGVVTSPEGIQPAESGTGFEQSIEFFLFINLGFLFRVPWPVRLLHQSANAICLQE